MNGWISSYNFCGIYACQSEHAVVFSAVPSCCHVGQNFKDFHWPRRWNSRTWPVFKDYPGLENERKNQGPVGTLCKSSQTDSCCIWSV